MTKKLKELFEIDEIVNNLYVKNPKLKDGKFGYAYKRFYEKNLKDVLEEMQEKMTDCRIDNALVDEKTKELLYDSSDKGGQKLYKYTKDGMKKLLEDTRNIKKEYEKKEVKIEPYYASDVPDMIEEEKEALKGCLIQE